MILGHSSQLGPRKTRLPIRNVMATGLMCDHFGGVLVGC